LFLLNEQRHSNPLVPLSLFKIKGLWEADVERHEALSNREEVQDLLLRPVAAGW